MGLGELLELNVDCIMGIEVTGGVILFESVGEYDTWIDQNKRGEK